MQDLLIIGVVAVIVGLAAAYVIRAKKRGQKCIGCPDSSCCSSGGKCEGGCNCNCHK